MALAAATPFCADVHLSEEADMVAGSAWKGYYSDHLMARGEVNGLQIGTLNLLNPKYVYRIEKYKKGWKESDLCKLHRLPESLPYSEIFPYPADRKGIDINSGLFLTERDLKLIDKIESALFEGDHTNPPLDVLSLQECSTAMAKALEFRLKARGVQVLLNLSPSMNGDAHNYVALLVKETALSIISKSVEQVFERKHPEVPPGASTAGEISREDPKFGTLYLSHLRPVLDVIASSPKGKPIRFVAVHIPTAGEEEEFQIHNLKQLAKYVSDTTGSVTPISPTTTVVFGDFNTGPKNVDAVFKSDFHDLSSYYTNIDEDHTLREIDHILVKNEDESSPVGMGDDERAIYSAVIAPLVAKAITHDEKTLSTSG